MDSLKLKYKPSVGYIIANIFCLTTASIILIMNLYTKQMLFILLAALLVSNIIYRLLIWYQRQSKTITFQDNYLILANRKKSTQIVYDEITLLEEKKNYSIVIHANKKYIINGYFTYYMSFDDKNRTTNIIREEIRNKTNKTVNIKYVK